MILNKFDSQDVLLLNHGEFAQKTLITRAYHDRLSSSFVQFKVLHFLHFEFLSLCLFIINLYCS